MNPSPIETACDYLAVEQFLSAPPALRLPTPQTDALFQRWAGTDTRSFLSCLTGGHARKAISAPISNAALNPEPELNIAFDVVKPGQIIPVNSHIVPTAFGYARLDFTHQGLCALHFGEESALSPARAGEVEGDAFGAAAICAQMLGATTEPIPVHLLGTEFEISVWLHLLNLPKGTLRCYQQIADELGRPSAVRAVASAIARNSIGYLIPCHRIIQATGHPGQYRWGSVRKQAMIGWESSRGRTT